MMSNHPFKLIASYPTVSADQPASAKLSEKDNNFSYTTVSFIEPETQAQQQRTVAVVKTSEKGGFYIDVFRSKKMEGGDKTHDYFYHNLGQTMTLTDLDGNAFSYMTIQLYNTATQTYTTVVSSSEVGKMISSFYYHADDAGDFQIYLRANSNLEDQVASIPIHLDSGQYLFFSFKIDDFSDTHIEVSNFSVYY